MNGSGIGRQAVRAAEVPDARLYVDGCRDGGGATTATAAGLFPPTNSQWHRRGKSDKRAAYHR